MSSDLAEWEVTALSEDVAEGATLYYRLIWDGFYGLSDVDVLDAGHHGAVMLVEKTGLPETTCLDWALDIAFEVKDRMTKENKHG